jgi:hypothetical protein
MFALPVRLKVADLVDLVEALEWDTGWDMGWATDLMAMKQRQQFPPCQVRSLFCLRITLKFHLHDQTHRR